MKRSILRMGGSCFLAVSVAVIGLIHNPAPAASDKEIKEAIQRAKEYIYRDQRNGIWEADTKPTKDSESSAHGAQFPGTTGLCLHALLVAGEQPTDPRIAPAIAFLRKTNIIGTYAMTERLQVLTLLPKTPDVVAAIKQDADALIGGIGTGDRLGTFYYYVDRSKFSDKWSRYDMSNSNYGALGIWAAAESGYEVPTKVWQSIDAGWRRQQQDGGGWSYRYKLAGAAARPPMNDTDSSLPTVPLTTAGVATLYATTDYLGRAAAPSGRKLSFEDPDIYRGRNWLIAHWKDFGERPTGAFRQYYGLYNLERVALFSGRRFFGPMDWYATGTDQIIKDQAANGSIENEIRCVAFALIFLAHGRAPVVLNKLEYERITTGGRPTTQPLLWWHQRPRDAARFSKWLGKQAERRLNWQIVDLKHGPSILHDAPILYITGEQAIRFSPEDESVLRRYCEDGGLILANAENGSPTFVEFIKKLGSKLFPSYEFRGLSPAHAIYTKQQFTFKDHRPDLKLLGLSNGSRELMLLVASGDVSKAWEMLQSKTKADCFEVPANIFHYATDRNNPRERGDSHIVLADEKIQTQRTIELARIKYNGNWDPEPGGWRRLAAILRNQENIELVCKAVTLGNGELKGMKLAHLTGTTKLTLSDVAKEELKQFIVGGGVLIVDAAGGSAEFGDSIRPQLAAFVPGLDPLPAPLAGDHALYRLTGHEIKEFGYRRMAQELPGGMPKGPRLRGIEVNGKPAVFFSEEDLSTALVGQQVGGMIGYAPETATAIVRNILLSVASAAPAAPAEPATKPAGKGATTTPTASP